MGQKLYSQKNSKITRFALSLMAALSASFVLSGALPVAVPNVSTYADTEAVTNVFFNAGDADARLFSLSLELDATESNNVCVAFGRDANENGVLERDEADAVVGWDSGSWFYRDRCAGVEERIARAASRRRLDWQLTLNSCKAAKSLASSDNDGTLFASAIPPTMFNADWNLMQVTARGLSDPHGVVVTEASGWGFNVILR